MTDKTISNYKVEMSSFVLGCGMLVIYGLVKLYGLAFLSLQVIYVVMYLRWHRHVFDLMKKSTVFCSLFISVWLVLGFLPGVLFVYSEPELSKIALAVGMVKLLVVFYIFCSPQTLKNAGWVVTK